MDGDEAGRGDDVGVENDQDVVCGGASPGVPGPGKPESPVLEPDNPEVERTVQAYERRA